MFKLFYFLFLINQFFLISTIDFKRVCYIRTDPSFEIPLNFIIESQLCSHIIIGFATVKDNSIAPNNSDDIIFYKKCKSLINELNSSTLLLLSIGGGNNANGFHSVVSTDINRKTFADSAIKIVEEYGFDGIDIDWEFPSWGTIYIWDKQNFNLLLKELRAGFTTYESKNSRNNKLLISVAVAAQYTIIERSYAIPDMMKHIDFVNLMSYDYHIYHWYWPFAGHNSPLFKRDIELGFFGTMNMEWSANYWNRLGAEKSKIMVGIPTYARSFRLAFRWLTIPGTLVIADNGDLTYSQVCEFLQTNGTKLVLDPEAKVPYAYRDYTWISFENEESAAQKVSWIKNNGFGGVMTFSLNADDFRNKCSRDKIFAIHSAIKSFS